MSIAGTLRRAGPYTTNGATTTFSFAFKVLSGSDVLVVTTADGVDTELTYGTDYTVALNADQDTSPGGTITTTTTYNGPELSIISDADIAQPTTFTNTGGFYPRVLNDALDRVTIFVQQIAEKLLRVPLLPLGAAPVGEYPVVLADGSFGWSEGTGSDAALRGDLASTTVGKGADLIAGVDQAILPEHYGAAGTGLVDDTAALIAAVAGLGGKRRRLLLTGTYLISSQILFKNMSDFHVAGGGLIKVANETTTADDKTALRFENCHDYSVYDIKVDGNRANRTVAEASAQLIKVHGGSRFHFRWVELFNGTTDGFYFRSLTVSDPSTRPTDFVIEDCDVHGCYRNNASFIASLRGKVIRGRYYNANGTAPQAGIGWEPNIDDIGGNEDFQVIDADVSNNGGFGVYAGGALANKRGKFQVTGSGNGDGLVEIGDLVDGMEVIARCGPHSASTVTRGLVDIAIGAANVTIDAEFRDITVPDNGLRSCLYTHSGAVNVTVKRLVYDTISIPALFCRAPGSVLENISGVDCTSPNATVSLDTGAARSTLRSLNLKRSTGQAIDILAPYPILEDFYIEDCDSTVACLRVRSTATDAVVRSGRVHETSGTVTAGQSAARFDVAMKEIGGFVTTGGYTSTNIFFQSAASFVGTKVYGVSPDPFSGSTAVDLPSIAAGGTMTASVGLALVNTTDRLHIQPQGDLAGVQLTQWCSVAGTFNYRATNPTAGAIDNASQTWTFSALKS